MSGYCTYSDFERFSEGFGTQYYGTKNEVTGTVTIATTTWDIDIESAYLKINAYLDAIPHIPIVPVGTNTAGSYNPLLVEWNAKEVIYQRLKARHLLEYGGGLPGAILDFGSRCSEILTDIADGKVKMDTDVPTQGIGYPVRQAGTSGNVFYTNWDTGHYDGAEYSKTYQVWVNDVTAGSTVGLSKFVVSCNGGYSWDVGTFTTGTAWVDIEDGIAVRWSQTLGTSHFVGADKWNFTCIPMNIPTKNRGAKFTRFGRG